MARVGTSTGDILTVLDEHLELKTGKSLEYLVHENTEKSTEQFYRYDMKTTNMI